MKRSTGIYPRSYGFEIRVKRGGKVYYDHAPHGTTPEQLELKRTQLLEHVLSTKPSAAPRGTFTRDLEKYIALAKHLAGWQKQYSHLRAFIPTLGTRHRGAITRVDLLALRSTWAEEGVKPKTINTRLSAFRAMYHALDGDDLPTPADRIKPLPVHRSPPTRIDTSLILAVDRELQKKEQQGYSHDAKTRARFRVLATTGARPSEVMRAQPQDVDLREKVWRVRDGKGGFRPIGIPLTREAIDAWKLFVKADAWGDWHTNSYARTLRRAGWPPGVRPYQLRHTIGLALSEADVDLADVGSILGHKPGSRMTSQHYVSPQWRRMQRAMGKIDGRVTWDTLPGHATRATGKRGNTRKNARKAGRHARPAKGERSE